MHVFNQNSAPGAGTCTLLRSIPCCRARCRAAGVTWTATSAGAGGAAVGPQGLFAHPQQGFCRQALSPGPVPDQSPAPGRTRAAGTTWGATGAARRDDAAGARARAGTRGRYQETEPPAPLDAAMASTVRMGTVAPSGTRMWATTQKLWTPAPSRSWRFQAPPEARPPVRVTLLFQPSDDGRVLHPCPRGKTISWAICFSFTDQRLSTPASAHRLGDGLRRGIHQRLQGRAEGRI